MSLTAALSIQRVRGGGGLSSMPMPGLAFRPAASRANTPGTITPCYEHAMTPTKSETDLEQLHPTRYDILVSCHESDRQRATSLTESLRELRMRCTLESGLALPSLPVTNWLLIFLSRKYNDEILKKSEDRITSFKRLIVVVVDSPKGSTCELDAVLILKLEDPNLVQRLQKAVKTFKPPNKSWLIGEPLLLGYLADVLAPSEQFQLIAVGGLKLSGLLRARLHAGPLRIYKRNSAVSKLTHWLEQLDSEFQGRVSWHLSLRPLVLILVLSTTWTVLFGLTFIFLQNIPQWLLPLKLTVYICPFLILAVFALAKVERAKSLKTLETALQHACTRISWVNSRSGDSTFLLAIASGFSQYHIIFYQMEAQNCFDECIGKLKGKLSDEQRNRLLSAIGWPNPHLLDLEDSRNRAKDKTDKEKEAMILLLVLCAVFYVQHSKEGLANAESKHLRGTTCLCQYVISIVNYFNYLEQTAEPEHPIPELLMRFANSTRNGGHAPEMTSTQEA